MNDPTLFDEPVLTRTVAQARDTDPDTSHDAAASIGVNELRASQAAVLRVLRDSGPGDFAAISLAYDAARYHDPDGYPNQSESGLRTRVAELVERNYVRDSGERVTLPSGRRAIVWKATS